jgi:hypothetical protein
VINEDPSSAKEVFNIADRSAEKWDSSSTAQVLARLQANPRVKYIVLAVPADACPVCQKLAGTYPKEQTPHIPVDLCSHPLGCRTSYIPYLDEIFP